MWRAATQPHRRADSAPGEDPMRFVHVTHRRNLPSIRRKGLRLGHDLVAPGVCCMPLLMFQACTERSLHSWDDDVVVAHQGGMSSSVMWRSLVDQKDRVAVVFQPGSDQWPADVYLWATKSCQRRLRQRLQHCPAIHWAANSDEGSGGRETHYALRVDGPRGMGRLFHHYLELQSPLPSFGDGYIEVVFRQPIPSRCIRRVVDLAPRRRGHRGAHRRRAIEDQGADA